MFGNSSHLTEHSINFQVSSQDDVERFFYPELEVGGESSEVGLVLARERKDVIEGRCHGFELLALPEFLGLQCLLRSVRIWLSRRISGLTNGKRVSFLLLIFPFSHPFCFTRFPFPRSWWTSSTSCVLLLRKSSSAPMESSTCSQRSCLANWQ